MANKKRKISFFGSRISEAVKIRNITKKKLCDISHITYGNLKKCIQSNEIIKDDLEKIAKNLNISFRYFTGEDDELVKDLYNRLNKDNISSSVLNCIFFKDSNGIIFTTYSFSYDHEGIDSFEASIKETISNCLNLKMNKYNFHFSLDEKEKITILQDYEMMERMAHDIKAIILNYIDMNDRLDTYIIKEMKKQGQIDYKFGVIPNDRYYYNMYLECKDYDYMYRYEETLFLLDYLNKQKERRENAKKELHKSLGEKKHGKRKKNK